MAVLTGGWFLQKGVGQEKNVYFQVRLFEEVMGHVLNSYVDPVDRDDLYESAIQGVLEQLGDPNTSFMPASTVDDFRIRMEGEYGGVGLEVIPRDGWVTVMTPLPGTPGTRAGVRAGDQIVEVEGTSTEGWNPDDVVDALRGRPGTTVNVGIRRPGVADPIPFSITRELIQLRSVPFSLMLAEGIGYVPLQTFSETSYQEVRAAIDSLRNEGMETLLLDLRGNTGGALDQSVAIADLFLDVGQGVVDTRGRGVFQNDSYQADRVQPFPDLTIVNLVDERSASASEIIAGALQDHDRALLVGAPTFGKGSVQTLYPLPGGNILRLTTARWYTPLGRSINKDREDQIRSMERSAVTLTGVFATLPDSVPKPPFITEGGRQVLGGGGITPDILVMADTLTLDEQRALAELDQSGGSFVNAVFNFAVRYLQERPGLTEDFALTSADLQEFRSLLEESDVELSSGAFQSAQRFIRFQLEREIALKAWGDAGEFRRMVQQDRAVQRVLDFLKDSPTTAELLNLATDASLSDWTPELLEPEATDGADVDALEPAEAGGA
jgi:carboxyl-terminal processing protease